MLIYRCVGGTCGCLNPTFGSSRLGQRGPTYNYLGFILFFFLLFIIILHPGYLGAFHSKAAIFKVYV